MHLRTLMLGLVCTTALHAQTPPSPPLQVTPVVPPPVTPPAAAPSVPPPAAAVPATPGTVVIASKPAPGVTTPFLVKPHILPGKIEAEHFDQGPAEVAFHDFDPQDHGAPIGAPMRPGSQVDIEPRPDASNKYAVGWTHAGEWLVYTVDVKEAGSYIVQLQVGSHKMGGTVHLEFNGVDKTGPMQIPDTGEFKKMTAIYKNGIPLEKGLQTMRLVMDSEGEESKSTGLIDIIRFSIE